MTIDEALKVLANEVRVAEANDRPVDIEAFRLGIEALKFVQDGRRDWNEVIWKRLLGETEK